MLREYSHPREWIRRFRSHRIGSVTIASALALPVLLGLSGLTLDAASWLASQRTLSAAADAGALAGALQVMHGRQSSEPAIQSLVALVAQENGYDQRAGDLIEVNHPPRSGPYAGTGAAVEVIIRRPTEAFLAQYFSDQTEMTVTARSVALAKSPPATDGAAAPAPPHPNLISVSLVE